MKKGLSILLVAAALFGFYGSAVSVNDILACKDYWEEAGAKSTADMNKLEDGLNQLKDNEQAYLDGVKQVADGEVALADAEKQLAEGEAQLADGRAELAKGEADYAAAPAKLADGEKKLAAGKAELAAGKAQVAKGEQDLAAGEAELAAGEKQLAEGEATLAKGEKDLAQGRKTAAAGIEGINTVIGYLNQVKVGYSRYSTDAKTGKKGPSFKSGYKQLEDGRKKMVGLFGSEDVAPLVGMIKELSDNENLGKNINMTSTYKEFDESVNDAITTFNGVKDMLDSKKTKLDTLVGALNGAKSKIDGIPAETPEEQKAAAIAQIRAGIANQLSGVNPEEELGLMTKIGKTDEYNQLCQGINGLKSGSQAAIPDAALSTAIGNVTAGLGEVSKTLSGYSAQLGAYTSPENPQSLATWDAGYQQLVGNQAVIYGSLKQIYEGILGNSTLKDAFQENAPALYEYMNGFTKGGVLGSMPTEDLPDFIAHADAVTNTYDPNIIRTLRAIRKAIIEEVQAGKAKVWAGRNELATGKAALEQGRAALEAGRAKLQDGKNQVAAGEKALAAGQAELAKGYADYKAAPAKLAAGRQQLADGEAKLADGYKQYEEGKKALADGKDQLAQYEDGEQQVRDGLATLVGTEADLDLQSILDRLNGDDDFDNGDNHLELDEGLAAVDVGRGYQAEDGDLITEEILGRAVGTGGLLAAGALAVIAAILSFLKKNKGAGVFAILAAAAGAFGAFYGTQAGTYFSSIAGSTVGATGWIAAGILGAVALVHAIAHFASGKAA